MQHSIIKKELVHLGESAAQAERAQPRAATGARGGRRGKSVELLRVGERVHAVELTCSCGEVSVIEFEYPEESPSGAVS